MKKSLFYLATAALVMISVLTNAQSPIDKIYEKYSGQEDFTAVNFTKEMFQMIQQMKIGARLAR